MEHKIKSIGKFFNLKYKDYDKWYDIEPGKTYFKKEKKILTYVPLEKNRTLEIGVGTGRFASALNIKFGIDPSIKMLKIAKRRGIISILGQGEHLPFKNNSFSRIFLIVTICFVSDAMSVIKEAGRLLQKEGELIIGIVPLNSPLGQKYFSLSRQGHSYYSKANFFTEQQIIKMCNKYNLKLKDIRRTDIEGKSGFVSIRTVNFN